MNDSGLFIYTDRKMKLKEALEYMTDDWLDGQQCKQTCIDMREALKELVYVLDYEADKIRDIIKKAKKKANRNPPMIKSTITDDMDKKEKHLQEFEAYIHTNGILQVKRYNPDIGLCINITSPHVKKYLGIIEAVNIDEAYNLFLDIMEILNNKE